MKQKLKSIIHFITNPRLLFCLAVAWLITNGWSYVLFAVGTYFEINWMVGLSGAYLAFLWLPVSPEKIVTLAIAIALLNYLFPDDKRTLAVLKQMRDKVKESVKNRKGKN